MASRKIGPFEVERQIGVGGMGIVYSAIYPAKNKRVALKVLSPGYQTHKTMRLRSLSAPQDFDTLTERKGRQATP